MKSVKASHRKASTFDPFIAARGQATERLVINAARTMDASNYSNLTEYCKTLALIITQLREAESHNPASPFHSAKRRNFSHVTLLRNEVYREIVERAFNASRSLVVPERPAEEDIDFLKVQNAGLAAQITLLKAKIVSMDSRTNGDSPDGVSGEYQEGGAIIEELRQQVFVLLKVYQAIRLNVGKAVRYTDVPTDGKEAGFFGVRGQIATLDEIDQMRRAEESLPLEMRKQLQKMLGEP